MAKDNFRYRTQKILQILLVVYVGLTLVETVLLRMAGMSWFEAVCNSFSTYRHGRILYEECQYRGVRQSGSR